MGLSDIKWGNREAAMKTKQVFGLVLVLSLFSFILGCEENAVILAPWEGDVNNYFKEVYWRPYILDATSPQGFSASHYLESTSFYKADGSFIVTTTRSGKENIKEYSQPIVFEFTDQKGNPIAQAAELYVSNINELYSFLNEVVYWDYTGEDRDAVINNAMQKLNMFLVDSPNDTSEPGEYAERAFMYGSVRFSEDPDSQMYTIITKADFWPYRKLNSTDYEIVNNTMYLYEYDRVMKENEPTPLSKGDLKFTYTKTAKYPDVY